MTQLTLTEKLKQETQEQHDAIEKRPFFSALMQHKLPRESYVAQLHCLSILYSSFERQLHISEHPKLRTVSLTYTPKYPLLQADLDYFDAQGVMLEKESIYKALAVVDNILTKNAENPLILLGYLYVFEGSTLGGKVIQPHVEAMFNLEEGSGTAFLQGYENSLRAIWPRFKEGLDQIILSDTEQAIVIEAAQKAFSGLSLMYETLYPPPGNNKQHVVTYNHEAGDHPMPTDEREIEAALSAGRKTWEIFPYYQRRYGERGRRFTQSDSLWLVTLGRLDMGPVRKQIAWLSLVLASRGMPQYLLEKHLHHMYDALTAAIPEKKEFYEKLLLISEEMKASREARLPSEKFYALADSFAETADPESLQQLPDAGLLIVSAIIDTESGVTESWPTLKAWLADQDRFPRLWCTQVNQFAEKVKTIILS